jgi:hypothetical protein
MNTQSTYRIGSLGRNVQYLNHCYKQTGRQNIETFVNIFFYRTVVVEIITY